MEEWTLKGFFMWYSQLKCDWSMRGLKATTLKSWDWLALDYTRPTTSTKHKLNGCSKFADVAGDAISVVLFVTLWAGLNYQSFNKRSFCLMNPDQFICRDVQNSLDCAQSYPLDSQTQTGHHFNGNAGQALILKF